MITAIPMIDNRLSNHFTKAHHFIFVDDNGGMICSAPNPALGSNCSGKTKLVEILIENNADKVLVKNIGTRMLSRLFDNNILVLMAENGRTEDVRHLLDDKNVTRLIDLSEARRSNNYEEKQASGQSCCHSDEKNKEHHSCCHSLNDMSHQHKNGRRCCQH